MRGILLGIFCLIYNMSFGQDDLEHNGLDLENICPSESCLYSSVKNPIIYEEDGIEHWKLLNVEMVLKKTGHFIVTGDLSTSGEELAAILNFKILFYGDFDELIREVESGEFEFYSEPGIAEPFVFRGQLTKHMAEKISYLYFEVVSSKTVPYYEISSDCYVACKNHKLKEAKKAFRKSD